MAVASGFSITRSTLLMLMLGVFLLGGVAVFSLIEQERERDLAAWQTRLSLIAHQHRGQLEGWLSHRRDALKRLAETPSLSLYLRELNEETTDSPASDTQAAAQAGAARGYLRHMLTATAQSGGFTTETRPQDIPANIERPATAGILLVDDAWRVLVATSDTTIPAAVPARVRRRDYKPHEIVQTGPVRLEDGRYAVLYRAPVYGVQATPGETEPLGFVVGIAMLEQAYEMLEGGVLAPQDSAETILITRQNGQLAYASALQNGQKPFALTVDVGSALAVAQAFQAPGRLIQAPDYRGMDVLAVARKVAGLHGAVVRKIDRAVALRETHERARWIVGSYTLIGLTLTAAALALWHHARATKARESASAYQAIAQYSERQEALLETLASHMPVAMLVIDKEQRIRYVNHMAALRLGMGRDALPGHTLEEVLGERRAARYSAQCFAALADNKTVHEHMAEPDHEGRIRHTEQYVIPIEAIPLPEEQTDIRGVLLIEQDITPLVREQEQRYLTIKQLVTALASVIDARIPHQSKRSRCLAILAEDVAAQLHSPPHMQETTGIAARLINVGKILLPDTLLAEEERIDETRRQQLRETMQHGYALLEDVPFDGPVWPVLNAALALQQGETLPASLSEETQQAAVIIATGNRLLAMLSERLSRPALTIDDALTYLWNEANDTDAPHQRQTRSVLAALQHYLENEDGMETLALYLRNDDDIA